MGELGQVVLKVSCTRMFFPIESLWTKCLNFGKSPVDEKLGEGLRVLWASYAVGSMDETLSSACLEMKI